MRQRRSHASRRSVGVCRCAMEHLPSCLPEVAKRGGVPVLAEVAPFCCETLAVRKWNVHTPPRKGGATYIASSLRPWAAVTRRGAGSLRPEHPRQRVDSCPRPRYDHTVGCGPGVVGWEPIECGPGLHRVSTHRSPAVG